MKITVLILLLLGGAACLQGQPLRKLSPVLQQRLASLKKDEQQVFWIVTNRPDSLRQLFTVIDERPGGLLVVKATWRLVDSLQALIRFVEVPRVPKEEAPLPVYERSLNGISQVHHFYPSLTGNDLVLSLKENKPDSTDIDFKGRWMTTPFSSSILSSHATSMATIIAGAGNSFYTGKGAAPAATISSADFASLLPETDAQYRQYQVAVQNHSYGTGIENYYGADAMAYDASVISNPTLVQVFSAGNSGEVTAANGPWAGIPQMGNLTGSFKMAKNIITVSATDSFGVVSPLSSKGPAYDGRVKPELVAFGQDGSSGAAALTSGAVLLLQQAYKEAHGGNLPPAALVKAVLLNSAQDLGAPGPDYLSGYGSLNAFKALRNLVAEQYIEGRGSMDFTLPVAAGIRQLKVTLCWTDPPAVVNASKALVNDLDLELVNGGSSWQPWVLNTKPVKDSLLLPAVRGRDSLNNVEQISLNNPVAGTYTIRVKGNSAMQSFYVAWQQDTADHFEWMYPLASDRLVGAQPNIIRWSSGFTMAEGLLEYSLDKGSSWQTAASNATLNSGYFYWPAPDTFCTALLRMSINGQVFTSDTFVISSPLTVQVGFNCTDSLMLYWNAVAPAYRVFALGDRSLQAINTLADTSIVIRNPGTQWYAVAPLLNNREGIRSYTINYTEQGVGCYLKNFLADMTNSQTARLTVELGTTLHVKRLLIEKLIRNEYHLLQTIEPVTTPYYEVMDNALQHGANTYRLKIELTNGLLIHSDPQTVYFFLNNQYLLFPNPAKLGTAVQLISEDPGENAHLVVYNVFGQKVLQQPLRSNFERVQLLGLKGGVYFVVVMKDGKRVFTERLMVY